MLKDNQDAWGHAMKDYLDGIDGSVILERDDHYIEPAGLGQRLYFAPYKKWSPIERKAMRYVRGRVLDIGCGAGRNGIYLQEKGHDVVGIDNSPLAVEVCKIRGLKDARLMSITELNSTLGTFDTVIMMGNNFGLFGTPERAKRLLKRFLKMTSGKGRIIATSSDIYGGNNPDHLAYHAANRARGRMSGQLRIRTRYKRYMTPWMDLLVVSPKEMEGILEGTGWIVKKSIGSGRYAAIIEKR